MTDLIIPKVDHKVMPFPTLQQTQPVIRRAASKKDTFELSLSEREINFEIEKLGVKFDNHFLQEVTPQKKADILTGLIISKDAGLKLPKIIEFENSYSGYFDPKHPKIIRMDSNYPDLIGVVVQETVHKNYITPFNKLFVLTEEFQKEGLEKIRKNWKIIKNELGENALDNIFNFVGITGKKLLVENKTWYNFSHEIKKLYYDFKGPKLRF